MSNVAAKKLARLVGAPFLARHEAAQAMMSQIDKVISGWDATQKVMAMSGDDEFVETDYRLYTMKDGIAAIPIMGFLLNRCYGCYGIFTGYQFIRKAYDMAIRDEAVRGILFDVDSPGGQYQGCFELVNYIAANKSKPIMAHVNGSATSGAYALVCVADTISATPSSDLANIGVVMIHRDESQLNANLGVKYTIISAGQHKAMGNRYAPLSEEDKKEFQADIDMMYEKFYTLVARLRNIDKSVILDLDSRIITAERAMQLKLIDVIQDDDDAVNSFILKLNGASVMSESKVEKKTEDVNTTFVEAAKPDTSVTVSATSERDRIKAIMTHSEAKGREQLANHLAFETDLPSEQAIAILQQSPIATVGTDKPTEDKPAVTAPKPNAFEAAMASSDNPNVGSDDSTSGDVPMYMQVLQAQTLATGQKFQ